VLRPEGVCALISLYPAVVIAFAVSDFMFSFLLLALFAYPLYSHYRSLRGMNAISVDRDNRLPHLLRKSLLLSSLISCSTVSSLVGMGTLWTVFPADAARSEQHLFIWALFFPSCDMLICSCIALFLTNTWMPPSISWVTNRFFRYSDENASPTSIKATAPATSSTAKNNQQVHALVSNSNSANMQSHGSAEEFQDSPAT
jgi:hypothetical protein